MNIKIIRKYKKDSYTIGNLYINGVWFCNTLEDKDRGLKQTDTIEDIKIKKVYGQTAIPIGTYKVALTYSPKFKRTLPYVNDVKGFEGIRIHSGNTATDTQGCILVGLNNVVGKVTNSRNTLDELIRKINGQDITLTIE